MAEGAAPRPSRLLGCKACDVAVRAAAAAEAEAVRRADTDATLGERRNGLAARRDAVDARECTAEVRHERLASTSAVGSDLAARRADVERAAAAAADASVEATAERAAVERLRGKAEAAAADAADAQTVASADDLEVIKILEVVWRTRMISPTKRNGTLLELKRCERELAVAEEALEAECSASRSELSAALAALDGARAEADAQQLAAARGADARDAALCKEWRLDARAATADARNGEFAARLAAADAREAALAELAKTLARDVAVRAAAAAETEAVRGSAADAALGEWRDALAALAGDLVAWRDAADARQRKAEARHESLAATSASVDAAARDAAAAEAHDRPTHYIDDEFGLPIPQFSAEPNTGAADETGKTAVSAPPTSAEHCVPTVVVFRGRLAVDVSSSAPHAEANVDDASATASSSARAKNARRAASRKRRWEAATAPVPCTRPMCNPLPRRGHMCWRDLPRHTRRGRSRRTRRRSRRACRVSELEVRAPTPMRGGGVSDPPCSACADDGVGARRVSHTEHRSCSMRGGAANDAASATMPTPMVHARRMV